ncbi:MAG TPA: hypothetical protein VL101_13575 [Nordella sp.]|nr:hypothetical protein [Nordella sp.]
MAQLVSTAWASAAAGSGAGRQDDDPAAELDAVKEVDDVDIDQADAARRGLLADDRRLDRAMMRITVSTSP